MKETRMNINNHDIVISYNERKNNYELCIDEILCIELTEEQITIFTTFIHSSIEFISKLKLITDEESKV